MSATGLLMLDVRLVGFYASGFDDRNPSIGFGLSQRLDVNDALERFSFTIVNQVDGEAKLAFPNRDGIAVFHGERLYATGAGIRVWSAGDAFL
jgi:hypothetical protein